MNSSTTKTPGSRKGSWNLKNVSSGGRRGNPEGFAGLLQSFSALCDFDSATVKCLLQTEPVLKATQTALFTFLKRAKIQTATYIIHKYVLSFYEFLSDLSVFLAQS